ncbi:uncharacterized protein LOC118803877 isoform X1 [Colossoma macropomum]|uniref:uncharacterized protein LOC118803877 isoform X1 n=1 Tax=Colossoma macropomum TaxID=42526 RepID=UPI0018654F56|nr:uncharacterized protein LOC118803877 isoform X1 [Colossoma macropomum]
MQVCLYLLLVLHVAEGCTLKGHGQLKEITAYTGGSVLLPCYCTDPQVTPETFTWNKFYSNIMKEISSESGQYRNRVQLVNGHSPGNLSLLISNLTEGDGGDYRCRVKGGAYRNIRLTVKDCTLTNNKETLQITARTGESVLLPCSCTELRLKPETFSWNKYINNIYQRIHVKHDEYRDRVQLVNGHSPGNLSLLISNLTEEDGGNYRCTVKGDTFRDIRLTVKGCTLTNNKETLQITARTGESVLLPCSCTELRLKPETFSWNKYINNIYQRIHVKHDEYRDRVQLVNGHSPGNLSLLISNLTEADGGDYRCTVKGDTFRDIRLTVKVNKDLPPSPTIKSKRNSIVTSTQSSLTTPSKNGSSGSPTKPEFFIYAAEGGLLLLIILTGIIYWRYRAQRRRQMESCERKSGWREDQETQNDSEVLYATVNDDKCNKVQETNNCEVLYAAVDKEDKRKKVEENDDVTYSTVVYFERSTSATVLLDT